MSHLTSSHGRAVTMMLWTVILDKRPSGLDHVFSWGSCAFTSHPTQYGLRCVSCRSVRALCHCSSRFSVTVLTYAGWLRFTSLPLPLAHDAKPAFWKRCSTTCFEVGMVVVTPSARPMLTSLLLMEFASVLASCVVPRWRLMCLLGAWVIIGIDLHTRRPCMLAVEARLPTTAHTQQTSKDRVSPSSH